MTKQIEDGKNQTKSTKDSSIEFGLVIDGKSLAFALDKKLDRSFLELALSCTSAICCRSTPKHKALVSITINKIFGKKISAFISMMPNHLIEI